MRMIIERLSLLSGGESREEDGTSVIKRHERLSRTRHLICPEDEEKELSK